jgi:hypothetical protein
MVKLKQKVSIKASLFLYGKVTTKDGDDSKTYDSFDDIKGDPDLEKYGIEFETGNKRPLQEKNCESYWRIDL